LFYYLHENEQNLHKSVRFSLKNAQNDKIIDDFSVFSMFFEAKKNVSRPGLNRRATGHKRRATNLLYTCREISTNSPFFNKQSQFPKKSNERK